MTPAGDAIETIDALRAGDRRTLAQSITLVESTRADHRAEAAALVAAALPHSGESIRVGITGPPGVGKSTFIEALGLHVLSLGHRLAVLTVDPSSARSGGSILGDKTRMVELARREEVFIRPSPGGRHLGGVARRTREAMLLCEAAGFDVVFVETIGVGQSEVEVAEMVDLFCMLVNPGSGDDLQGIKRGITELADLVVVNKSDGDLAAAAGRTRAAYAEALGLISPRWQAWSPRAVACSSLQRTGIADVWDAVEEFTAAVDASGERRQRRGAQARSWMWSEIRDELLDDFRRDRRVTEQLALVEKLVDAGDISATEAARRLLDRFERGD
jgi:LAO/AO transport system kinase